MFKVIKSILFILAALVRPDRRAKIVFYHDIGLDYTPMGTPRELFWSHMQYLRKGDVVGFDDGFRGVWDDRDRLRNMGIRPMISVAPRLVGVQGYLTWDEIRVLKNDYGFDVVCHTWSHQTLCGPMIDESPIEERTDAWYERELIESRKRMSVEIGGEVEGLCFPVGYYSDDLIERCKRAGYKKVYSSCPGVLGDEYVQPRCLVQDLGVLAFRAVLAGGMTMFERRYLKRHFIEENKC